MDLDGEIREYEKTKIIWKQMNETRYKIPNGDIINVKDARLKIGEIQFDPKLYK